MGLNVSTSMGFENRNFLRNAAREILQRSGASQETTSEILEKTIFDENIAQKSELSILRASTQISLNKSLSETLKYLKSHAGKKQEKAPVFGELWNSFSENNGDFELYEFEIDETVKNIFAAA